MPNEEGQQQEGQQQQQQQQAGAEGQQQQQQSEMVTIPKEEFEGIKKRLDSFETRFTETPVQQPQVPQGPTVAEQVQGFDDQITEIGKKIDAAVTEGKPVSSLMSERDRLNEQRTTLRIRAEHIDPAFNAGIQTIGQLTDEVTKSQMPHLAIPEVKIEYDRFLTTLTPEQKMNPQMRTYAYNLAVGAKHEAIIEQAKETWMRESVPPGGQVPGDQTGRNSDTQGNKIPKPEEILSKGNINALTAAGRTVDGHYQSLGYPGGWEDFWEQTGKYDHGYEEKGGEE